MDATTNSPNLVKQANTNANALELELLWLAEVLDARIQAYFYDQGGPLHFQFEKAQPPDLDPSSNLARLITKYSLTAAQRLVIALVIAPYIRPQLLDVFFVPNKYIQRGHTEFGGLQAQGHSGFIPTIETALFVLCGDCLNERFNLTQEFTLSSVLFTQGIIEHESLGPLEPWTSSVLTMPKSMLDHLTTGGPYEPAYGKDFPAKKITTSRKWEELVLPESLLSQLREIADWVTYSPVLMQDWGMDNKLSPGYTALFYGPPGTGKTFSASLLGYLTNRDVYKIDLSLLVSKYIGETEKNLAKVFDAAEHKGWILFFDEADAIFGKRTQVDDAKDRYANQEVSYLLQRIESFDGIVILASNLKANIDDAFIRRFQSIVAFPMPSAAERLAIWQGAFSEKSRLDDDVDLRQLAKKYEIAGGTIMNIVRFSSLKTLSEGSKVIRLASIEQGLRREFAKEGRRI
ncbi:ATP-binding protein [Glaciecola sp. 1036]|uniref:ATP-binding protein n=1 Tax=Alteromonadaceae TaxID=72275 RepID=UPI003D006F32